MVFTLQYLSNAAPCAQDPKTHCRMFPGPVFYCPCWGNNWCWANNCELGLVFHLRWCRFLVFFRLEVIANMCLFLFCVRCCGCKNMSFWVRMPSNLSFHCVFSKRILLSWVSFRPIFPCHNMSNTCCYCFPGPLFGRLNPNVFRFFVPR